MLRPVLAIALLAAAGAPAAAETYLGLGLGTSADMSSTTTNAPSPQTVQGNGRSGKLLLGIRFGRLSIEGAAMRYGMYMDQYGADNTQLSAALKYSFPLGDSFEAFVRGGLVHDSIDIQYQMAQTGWNASGNGWLLGGGFEYRLNALVTGASLFVDYEHTSTGMTNGNADTFDQTTGVWMAGVTLSL